MYTPDYDIDNFEFLVSRSLDEELSGPDQQRLDAAREAEGDGTLSLLQSEYRALDRLVRENYRRPLSDADCDILDGVRARLAVPTSLEFEQKLDRVLQQWAADTPVAHSTEFVHGVLNRLPRRKRRARALPFIMRIGVPLAAAAAIAIVVLPRFRSETFQPVRHQQVVMIRQTAQLDDVPRRAARAGEFTVKFNRQAVSGPLLPDSTGGSIAIGHLTTNEPEANDVPTL